MIFQIEENLNTGGWHCFFNHKGKEYWADLSDIDTDTECVIFECFEDGSVNTSKEAYCSRGMNITPSSLIFCIKEFVMLTK